VVPATAAPTSRAAGAAVIVSPRRMANACRGKSKQTAAMTAIITPPVVSEKSCRHAVGDAARGLTSPLEGDD